MCSDCPDVKYKPRTAFKLAAVTSPTPKSARAALRPPLTCGNEQTGPAVRTGHRRLDGGQPDEAAAAYLGDTVHTEGEVLIGHVPPNERVAGHEQVARLSVHGRPRPCAAFGMSRAAFRARKSSTAEERKHLPMCVEPLMFTLNLPSTAGDTVTLHNQPVARHNRVSTHMHAHTSVSLPRQHTAQLCSSSATASP